MVLGDYLAISVNEIAPNVLATDFGAILIPNRNFLAVGQNDIVFGNGRNGQPMHQVRPMYPQKDISFELLFHF